MKFAVLVWGGWEGHEPRECVERFLPFLRSQGFELLVSDSLEVFADAGVMATLDRWVLTLRSYLSYVS